MLILERYSIYMLVFQLGRVDQLLTRCVSNLNPNNMYNLNNSKHWYIIALGYDRASNYSRVYWFWHINKFELINGICEIINSLHLFSVFYFVLNSTWYSFACNDISILSSHLVMRYVIVLCLLNKSTINFHI